MAARITGWVGFALLSALYLYLAITAVGNLVLLPQVAASLSLEVNAIGWFWLAFGVALPIAAYVLALVIVRRRGLGVRLLVLAAGLAAVAAWQLEILHLVPQSTFFA